MGERTSTSLALFVSCQPSKSGCPRRSHSRKNSRANKVVAREMKAKRPRRNRLSESMETTADEAWLGSSVSRLDPHRDAARGDGFLKQGVVFLALVRISLREVCDGFVELFRLTDIAAKLRRLARFGVAAR